MGSYKVKFRQLQQHPELPKILEALEKGFDKHRVDFYLVGAVARDLWMTAINGIPPNRITRDIDFAVLINDKGTYESLKAYLIQKEGFQPVKENAFVLMWKGMIQVDLLPFGDITDNGAKVSIEGIGLTSLNMPGFMEVYEAGLPKVELEGKHKFKFCTLPGIVILKLLAWQDRPEIRKDDIKDVGTLLQHFFDMYADQIYTDHSDLFGDPEFDLPHIAARVMGREMKKITHKNTELYSGLADLLERNTESLPTSQMAISLSGFFDTTVDVYFEILQELKKGFEE